MSLWQVSRLSRKMHLLEHQCFIHQIDPKDSEKEKKSKKQLLKHLKIKPRAAAYVEPSVFVYADFESMLSANKTLVPILVCALTSLSKTFSCFYGSECTAELLAFLIDLAVNEFGEERKVICIFNNLEGHDAVFL